MFAAIHRLLLLTLVILALAACGGGAPETPSQDPAQTTSTTPTEPTRADDEPATAVQPAGQPSGTRSEEPTAEPVATAGAPAQPRPTPTPAERLPAQTGPTTAPQGSRASDGRAEPTQALATPTMTPEPPPGEAGEPPWQRGQSPELQAIIASGGGEDTKICVLTHDGIAVCRLRETIHDEIAFLAFHGEFRKIVDSSPSGAFDVVCGLTEQGYYDCGLWEQGTAKMQGWTGGRGPQYRDVSQYKHNFCAVEMGDRGRAGCRGMRQRLLQHQWTIHPSRRRI